MVLKGATDLDFKLKLKKFTCAYIFDLIHRLAVQIHLLAQVEGECKKIAELQLTAAVLL